MSTAGGLLYPSGGTYLQALSHILCADVSDVHRGSAYRGRSISLERIDGGNFEFNRPMIVHAKTVWRRLISTLRRYLGIAPHTTQPGDKICILSGGSVPFLLRQQDDH